VIRLSNFYLKGKNPIYVDKTGFQNTLVKNYFYVKKGQPAVIEGVVRTRNLSVICAITPDEII
jgi:hypothetical protein